MRRDLNTGTSVCRKCEYDKRLVSSVSICIQAKSTHFEAIWILHPTVTESYIHLYANWCEVIHQWREKAVLLFVPEKFDFQCDLWQDVEHYTLQQAHITVLLIMQLTAKPQLILQAVIHMSITKWTVVLCHTEQHAMHSLLQ